MHVAESDVLPPPIKFILGMEFLDGLNVSFKNGSVRILDNIAQEASVQIDKLTSGWKME